MNASGGADAKNAGSTVLNLTASAMTSVPPWRPRSLAATASHNFPPATLIDVVRPPTAKVVTTASRLGSRRATVDERSLATHTDPLAASSADGALATAIVRRTRAAAGSILETV